MARILTQAFPIVGAILEKDGKILLVRESGGTDKGMWSHPAGLLDVGEHPLVGVQREVKEESGYTFTPTHILGVYSLVREDRKVGEGAMPHPVKIIFLGKISEDQSAIADDVTEVRWFAPEEIYAMPHPPLRDLDIQTMVRDYLAGKRYPLDLLSHSVSR